jgi:hypothetical protein
MEFINTGQNADWGKNMLESLFQKETMHHEPFGCLRTRRADPPRINGESLKE